MVGGSFGRPESKWAEHGQSRGGTSAHHSSALLWHHKTCQGVPHIILYNSRAPHKSRDQVAQVREAAQVGEVREAGEVHEDGEVRGVGEPLRHLRV